MNKYRAWHEGNKGFQYFTLEEMWKNGFHVGQSIEYGNKDDIKRGADGLYATEEFFKSEFMNNTFCLNVADWKQFTGLHDKNGKEIYEGDRIRVDGMTYVVEFKEGSFIYGDTCYPASLWRVVENCEIIGNIHQNPELLEELA